jgi:hypothetical protein
MRVLQRPFSFRGIPENAPIHLPKEKRAQTTKVAQTAAAEVTKISPQIAQVATKVAQVSENSVIITQRTVGVAQSVASIFAEAADCRTSGNHPETQNHLADHPADAA